MIAKNLMGYKIQYYAGAPRFGPSHVPPVFYCSLFTPDGEELGGVVAWELAGIWLIGTELNGQLGKDPKATVTYVNGPPSPSAGFRKVTPNQEKLILEALRGK